jgi:hypothetical protein
MPKSSDCFKTLKQRNVFTCRTAMAYKSDLIFLINVAKQGFASLRLGKRVSN